MKLAFLLALIAFCLFTNAYVGTSTNSIATIKEVVPFLNASSTSFHALIWQMPAVQSFTVDTNHSFNVSQFSANPSAPIQFTLTNFSAYWRNLRPLSGFILSFCCDGLPANGGWTNLTWTPFAPAGFTGWSNYSYAPQFLGAHYWVFYANDSGSPSNWSSMQPQLISIGIQTNPPGAGTGGGGGGGGSQTLPTGQTILTITPPSVFFESVETYSTISKKIRIKNNDVTTHNVSLQHPFALSVIPSGASIKPNQTLEVMVSFSTGDSFKQLNYSITVLNDGQYYANIPVFANVNKKNALLTIVGDDTGMALLATNAVLINNLVTLGGSNGVGGVGIPGAVAFILILVFIGWLFGKFKKEGWASAFFIAAIFVSIFYAYVLYLQPLLS